MYTLVIHVMYPHMPTSLYTTDHWVFDNVEQAYEVADRVKINSNNFICPIRIEESVFKKGRLSCRKIIHEFSED